MKVRRDFVTNSSSSSFIICKKYLSPHQIESIYNHINFCTGWLDFPWSINEDDNYIVGYVDMDNFDMYEYLTNIEVPMQFVRWGEFPFNFSEEN